MRDKTLMGATLATAAAVAFSTPASAEFPIVNSGTPTEIKCAGINACRGQSLCKTMANSCQGQNACKGHGWLYINAPTPDEAIKQCKAKGGTVGFF
jgi:hypothetical protein